MNLDPEPKQGDNLKPIKPTGVSGQAGSSPNNDKRQKILDALRAEQQKLSDEIKQGLAEEKQTISNDTIASQKAIDEEKTPETGDNQEANGSENIDSDIVDETVENDENKLSESDEKSLSQDEKIDQVNTNNQDEKPESNTEKSEADTSQNSVEQSGQESQEQGVAQSDDTGTSNFSAEESKNQNTDQVSSESQEPGKAKYAMTGDPTQDAELKRKNENVDRDEQWRKEDQEQREKELAEKKAEREQEAKDKATEKEDGEKSKIEKQLGDEKATNGDYSPVSDDDVNKAYQDNQDKKQGEKESKDGESSSSNGKNIENPPDGESKSLKDEVDGQKDVSGNAQAGTDTQSLKTTNPGENDTLNSPDYANYAPTGDKAVDDANQAKVDGLRQQRDEDNKNRKQEREEKANSKVENQQRNDYTDGKRDTAPTKDSIANQQTADQEKKLADSQNPTTTGEKKDSNSSSDNESEAFGKKTDNLKDKSVSKNAANSSDSTTDNKPKLGSRLRDAGNKLNAAKEVIADPGAAAKKAAEDKIKVYAAKAAKEAAKRAAQAAARTAQAAGRILLSAVQGAVAGIGALGAPILIGIGFVLLFMAVFGVIVYDAYCTPRPLTRGIIEYSLTGDEKNLIETGLSAAGTGDSVAKNANVVARHSDLYNLVYKSVCSDKNPDNCNPVSAAGGAISGEYGTPTGKISASQCAKLKEYKGFMDKASADYGIPTPIIGAIMSRESDVGEGNSPKGCAGYGDSGKGHGLGQIDGSSGAWGGNSSVANQPVGLPTTVKDKDGKPFIWNDCESGVRYVAYHVVELEKLYSAKIATAGPKGSKAWWIRLLAANNAGGNGATKGDSATTGGDYGTDTLNRAADVVKCLGAAADSKVANAEKLNNLVDYLSYDQTLDSDYIWAAITSQANDRQKNPQKYTGEEKAKQNGNIVSRILDGLGGIDVEAAGTPGSFVYSGEDVTVLGLISSGKVTDVIPEVSKGKRPKLDVQIKQKELEPNSLKGLISIVNSGKFDSVRISSAYRAGDNPTSGHGSGQKFDIDAVTYKGKQYTHQSANDGDAAAIEAFYELAKTAKDTGGLIWIISGGGIYDKMSSDSYLTGVKLIQDDRRNPIYGAIHENHFDLRFDPGGTIKAAAGGTSSGGSGVGCGPCGSSGAAIGTSTGPGTVSTGGEFTSEVRAFLDTIANWEAEGADKLGPISYNSGNAKANLFDATKYATSFSVIDSPGNGGRYQVIPKDDKPEANIYLKKRGLKEVVGFDAPNQDLFALGRWYYRQGRDDNNPGKNKQSLGDLLKTDFKTAAGIASGEWASAPVVEGFRHTDARQSKASLATYESYYKQRLSVYGKTAYFEGNDIQTAKLSIPNPFGPVQVEAADTTSSVAEKRTKLKDLFTKDYISQTKNVSSSDVDGYATKFDDNMIEFMYDLYYKAGVTWIGGPANHSRSNAASHSGNSYDFWAFGNVSEIEGANKPIKGYTGTVAFYPDNGGDPGNKGNEIDPRMFRMIDAASTNPAIKSKTIEIFKKVVDSAYSTGIVKQYGKGQSYGTTGFPNVFGHDELAKVVGTTKMFGHSNGSVLPLGGSPPNNGHITHLHISLVAKKLVAYTGLTGTPGGSSNCAPCVQAQTTPTPVTPPKTPVDTPDTEEVAYLENYQIDSEDKDKLAFSDLFSPIEVQAAFGSKPSSFSAISGDAKYSTFLKEIADTRGYEQYKDAKGQNTEMQTALAAMISASGGRLTTSNTYRSYDKQVETYFATGGVTSPISKYWGPNLTPAELATVKAAYLARGTVSAPPGYSQHSTGLAVDFSPVEDNFENTGGYTWLKANATTFGFKESYPKGTSKGAGFEPWHWQFVGNATYKLSTPLTSFQIGGSGSGGATGAPCAPSTSNLGSNTPLASKNPPSNLIITDETGTVIKQINGGQAVTGASIFKVIIASTGLKNSLDLNKQLVLSKDIWLPDETTYTKDQSVSVGELLKSMLNDSNNTAANALMKEIGGMSATGGPKPTGFSEKAKAAGYGSVAFDRWFTAAKNIPGMDDSGKRLASVEDTNKALIDIFKNSGGGYDIAKAALQTNPHKFQGAQNIEAFKHGNTSKVLAVSSKLNIDGKTYYATMLYNIDPTSLLVGDPIYTFKSSNPITKFINEIKGEFKP